jgi:peptidoglycan/xylan/chitin deacetylase (PgdA/CDA1 family)
MRRTLRSAAVCVLAIFVVGAGGASAGTRVVFTFDVESNAIYRLPEQVDAVCQDGAACGLMEIVRLLDERRWSGTFFLNVYEHRLWGETAMKDLVLRLQNAHQDLGLHTHPDGAYDAARPEMYEYTLDEQTTIIRDGARLLGQWTGLPVVSHRAGAYSADAHTLTALERNGIFLDSSFFLKYPKCRLNDLGMPSNVPSLRGRVIEIPVTAYERTDRPNILAGAVAPVTTVRKIDADWLIDEHEMRAAIDAAVDANFPVVVVFLHSFSFMDERRSGAPVADRHAIQMFKATLDYVAQKQLPVVTMRDLANDASLMSSRHKDLVPQIAMSVDVPHYAWRRFKAADAGSRVAGAGIVLITVTAAIAFAVLRRRTVARDSPARGRMSFR